MNVRINAPSGISLFPLAGVYAVPRGTEGSVTAGTYHDLTTETTALSSSWHDWQFDMRDGLGEPDPEIENLTPTICSVDNFPLVERIISGTASIRVTWGETFTVRTLDMKTVGGSESLAVTGFVSVTVGALSWDIIEPLLVAGGDAALFDGSAYNADCWAADFDFSGVSIHSQFGTNITARHKLFAAHYCPAVGTSITDRAPDGTTHVRTVVAYNTGVVPGSGKFVQGQVAGDMAVALMSDDAHEDLAIYPVVGPWIYENTVDSDGRAAFVQAWVGIKLNQFRIALICGRTDRMPIISELTSGTYNGETFTDVFTYHYTDWGPASYLPSFLSAYSSRYAQSIVGDSGSPRFYPLSANSMALAGVISGASGFTTFPNQSVINTCIASASANGGYVPTLTVTVAPDPTL